MNACALTDIGRTRQINQDFVYCSDRPIGNLPNLYIVADGMGGHQAGDYASRMAVELLLKQIREDESLDPIVILKNAVKVMNYLLWQQSMEDPSLAGMGTTLVAAVIISDVMTVVNVGDSRLYVVKDGIHQITRDHSLVEELVAQGQITRDSMEYQTKKNVITRAIGVDDQVHPDFYEVHLEPGEKVLLCSDGLTNMVTDEEICRIITRNIPIEEKTSALIEAANLSGGRDNITAILIER